MWQIIQITSGSRVFKIQAKTYSVSALMSWENTEIRYLMIPYYVHKSIAEILMGEKSGIINDLKGGSANWQMI